MPMPPPHIRRDNIRHEIDHLEEGQRRFPAFHILTEQVPDEVPDPDRPAIDPSNIDPPGS